MDADHKDREAEWLRRAADLEDEAGGFPLETGVILNAVRPKPACPAVREQPVEVDPAADPDLRTPP